MRLKLFDKKTNLRGLCDKGNTTIEQTPQNDRLILNIFDFAIKEDRI